jgi:hypothetical protein
MKNAPWFLMEMFHPTTSAGEQIVRQAVESGLGAVILYPTGIIGPYDFKPSHFGEVLRPRAETCRP